MLNNLGNLKTEFLVQNQSSTTAAFYTDAIIAEWADQSHQWAAAFHKWPFTEGRVSTTWASTEEWSFEGYKSDSFRIVQVGGKRLRKLDFANYQIFREEEPSADDRVFSDFGRIVFINPNIDLSGTLTAWGQYIPTAFDITDLTAKTVFSDNEPEGNEAIVSKMLSLARNREKKLTEAKYFEDQAKLKLDELYKRILEEQYAYQTHPDSGGMWERFDVLRGGYEEEITRENQF